MGSFPRVPCCSFCLAADMPEESGKFGSQLRRGAPRRSTPVTFSRSSDEAFLIGERKKKYAELRRSLRSPEERYS